MNPYFNSLNMFWTCATTGHVGTWNMWRVEVPRSDLTLCVKRVHVGTEISFSRFFSNFFKFYLHLCIHQNGRRTLNRSISITKKVLIRYLIYVKFIFKLSDKVPWTVSLLKLFIDSLFPGSYGRFKNYFSSPILINRVIYSLQYYFDISNFVTP